jgi:hypothetical protein
MLWGSSTLTSKLLEHGVAGCDAAFGFAQHRVVKGWDIETLLPIRPSIQFKLSMRINICGMGKLCGRLPGV